LLKSTQKLERGQSLARYAEHHAVNALSDGVIALQNWCSMRGCRRRGSPGFHRVIWQRYAAAGHQWGRGHEIEDGCEAGGGFAQAYTEQFSQVPIAVVLL